MYDLLRNSLKKRETIVNISSFSDFRHLWQLINVSEIGNLRVGDHVISPNNFLTLILTLRLPQHNPDATCKDPHIRFYQNLLLSSRVALMTIN